MRCTDYGVLIWHLAVGTIIAGLHYYYPGLEASTLDGQGIKKNSTSTRLDNIDGDRRDCYSTVELSEVCIRCCVKPSAKVSFTSLVVEQREHSIQNDIQ